MSDDLQQQEAPELDTGAEVSDEAAQGNEAQPSNENNEVETRARSQGWVSKDEFRGDPEKWRPADEFVKRGEELLPIALERARAAERRTYDLESQYKQDIARLERMNNIALDRQRADLQARYDSAMRTAAANGDLDQYDQLSQNRERAIAQHDEHIQKQVRGPDQPHQMPAEVQQAVTGWVAQNDWFNRDPELNAVAQQQHMKLLREQPGLSLQDNLAQTKKYVQQRYPERFGVTQRAPVMSSVESGGRMSAGAAARAKSGNDLPADVRAVAERFVKQGLFKDVNEYAREFFSDN